MNQHTAMNRCNPQAFCYQPKVDYERDKSASFDEVMGFIASCRGVSSLAHYSLMPGDDTHSRKSCAVEIKRTLSSAFSVQEIEAAIDVFVNRHCDNFIALISLIDDSVYRLLTAWESEWLMKLREDYDA